MRKDFNWSQLDRLNLYNMLYTAGSDIVGKKMPVKTLHKRLSAHIKSCLPVMVKKWQYDTKQDRGFPYMGGSYDSVLDKKGQKKFIEVVLSYNRQRMNQEYYGHRDEMGAHAFNIACEMIDRFGYDPVAIRYHMDNLTSRTKRGTFTKFLATFDWDHDHIKVRQMKQKVLKQLEYAAIGRPFKTTTHLTY